MNEVEKFGHKIKMSFGSSTGEPGFKGMQTSDIREWISFCDKWFIPHANFRWKQIKLMVDICLSEHQLFSLMNMLSEKDYNN